MAIKLTEITSRAILSRDKLVNLRAEQPCGSAEYIKIDSALQSSLPFYTDPTRGTKYSLFVDRLLGGGPGNSKEISQRGYAIIQLKEDSTLTISKSSEGKLVATLTLPSSKESKQLIIGSRLIINGKEIEAADLEPLISLFQNLGSSLLWKAKHEGAIITLSSRTAPLMIEQGIEGTKNGGYYSLLEELDEAYIKCCLVTDNQRETTIKKFLDQCEHLLEKAQWSEEAIDVRVRKATIDALKILLIPSYRPDRVNEAFQKVISQFKLIEKEIRLFNLSLDGKEAIDFHLYRGLAFSKLPPSIYREERTIATADGIMLMSSIQKLLEKEGSAIFYKKVAHGCKLFAEGINHPETSPQFIALGSHLIQKARSLGFGNPILDQIEGELVSHLWERAAEPINLELLENPLAPEEAKDPSTESLEEEKIDKILYRTYQDIPNPHQLISNLKPSLEVYARESEEEKDPVQQFRMRLRQLFVESHLFFLTAHQEPATLIKKYSQLKEDLHQLEQKIPNNLRARAEFHLFRGSILVAHAYRAYGRKETSIGSGYIEAATLVKKYSGLKEKLNPMEETVPESLRGKAEIHFFRSGMLIAYPREKEDPLEYATAIADFNKVRMMGAVFPKDICGFHYMTYGAHMLKHDPLRAVRLLQAASRSVHCEDIKKKSERLLDQFFKSFHPIRPSVGFDPKQLHLN